MSTKSNANFKAIELTQSELDSVTGGNIGAMQAMLQAMQRRRIQQALSSYKSGQGSAKS
jgi:hypothetical protein